MYKHFRYRPLAANLAAYPFYANISEDFERRREDGRCAEQCRPLLYNRREDVGWVILGTDPTTGLNSFASRAMLFYAQQMRRLVLCALASDSH